MSEGLAISSGGSAATTLEATVGEAATAKLPAQVCASGSGACEIAQQLLAGLDTVKVGFSVPFIPIRSQSVFVAAFAHPFGCPCSIAQAEACNGPKPATPSATTRTNILRIFIGLQLYHTLPQGDPSQWRPSHSSITTSAAGRSFSWLVVKLAIVLPAPKTSRGWSLFLVGGLFPPATSAPSLTHTPPEYYSRRCVRLAIISLRRFGA